MIPFIFSHLGIIFAYHTTFFLANPRPALHALALQESRTQVGEIQPAKVEFVHQIEQQSFQKHILFYKFATTPQMIKVYTFFNQK